MDAYRLGMGPPVSISAETGDGMIDLCEALIPFIDQKTTIKTEDSSEIPAGSCLLCKLTDLCVC
mgnify:CR=1 FL=1